MNPLTINMSRDELLHTLITNREKHVTEFQQLAEAYQLAAHRALKKEVDRISTDITAKRLSKTVRVHLSPPTSHADEYDRAIAMVQHHDGARIAIDEHQYDRFVLDNWGWKQEFSTLSASYRA